MDGSLFDYHEGLQAFLSGSHSEQMVVFVGGLTDGFLATEYLQTLAPALQSQKWSLVQALFSSSYSGYGTSSLFQDAFELDKLLGYLCERFAPHRIVLMGHSTGTQSIITYLREYSSSARERGVAKIVLQGPVSDRDYMNTLEHTAKWLSQAQRMIAEGNGLELLPRAAHEVPITAERYASFAGRLGPDDMWSADLTEDELDSIFKHVTVPCLLAMSLEDEYLPQGVDCEALADRLHKALCRGVPDHIGSTTTGAFSTTVACGPSCTCTRLLLSKANHAVAQEGPQRDLVQGIVDFVERAIFVPSAHSPADVGEVWGSNGVAVAEDDDSRAPTEGELTEHKQEVLGYLRDRSQQELLPAHLTPTASDVDFLFSKARSGLQTLDMCVALNGEGKTFDSFKQLVVAIAERHLQLTKHTYKVMHYLNAHDEHFLLPDTVTVSKGHAGRIVQLLGLQAHAFLKRLDNEEYSFDDVKELQGEIRNRCSQQLQSMRAVLAWAAENQGVFGGVFESATSEDLDELRTYINDSIAQHGHTHTAAHSAYHSDPLPLSQLKQLDQDHRFESLAEVVQALQKAGTCSTLLGYLNGAQSSLVLTCHVKDVSPVEASDLLRAYQRNGGGSEDELVTLLSEMESSGQQYNTIGDLSSAMGLSGGLSGSSGSGDNGSRNKGLLQYLNGSDLVLTTQVEDASPDDAAKLMMASGTGDEDELVAALERMEAAGSRFNTINDLEAALSKSRPGM